MRGSFLNDLHLAVALRRARDTGWVVRTNPYEGGSDHTVFTRAGVPALLNWHFTDRYYHTNLDTVDKMSAAEMQHVAIAVGDDGAVPRLGGPASDVEPMTTADGRRRAMRGWRPNRRTTPRRRSSQAWREVVRRGARSSVRPSRNDDLRSAICDLRSELVAPAAGPYISVTYCLTMRRVEKRGTFERIASRTIAIQRRGRPRPSRSRS